MELRKCNRESVERKQIVGVKWVLLNYKVGKRREKESRGVCVFSQSQGCGTSRQYPS